MYDIQGIYKDKLKKNNKLISIEERLNYLSSIHKDIKINLKKYIKPNMKLLDIVKFIEKNIEEKLFDQINKGKAFPVGVSINNCAAHFTCHDDCDKIILFDDIISIDYGLHYEGTIIDSAFTFSLNKKFDELIKISKNATNFAIKNLEIGMDINNWGNKIEQFVKSHKIVLDDKNINLRTITKLTGHNIKPWIIHGGIYLPSCDMGRTQEKLVEGVYAVEIFVTTGNDNITFDYNDNSHYTIEKFIDTGIKRLNIFQKELIKRFKTLPFCDRWVSDLNFYDTSLKILSSKNVIKNYPPIYDETNCYVSQFENTVYLKKNKKIIF